MPNHVENKLKVKGKKEDIEDFKKEAKNAKEAFSIHNLFPMPKELENTKSPPEVLVGIAFVKRFQEYQEEIKKNPDWGTGKPISGRESKRLIDKYRANNWYDWCIKNWGTKWGSYDSELYGNGKTYLKYIFNTAWSPPVAALEKISADYPNLLFELSYKEEGMGFKGKATFQNGLIEDQEL